MAQSVNVVLTRERGRNEGLSRRLPAGASVTEVPLTSTRFFETRDVHTALKNLANFRTFRVLVVSSARSARYASLARDALAGDAKILSVGEATSRALRDLDVDIDHEGASGVASLSSLIDAGPVLVLGAAQIREELVDLLAQRDIVVERVACYETVPVAPTIEQARSLRRADVIYIGAPSAWSVAKSFVAKDCLVVVPGDTTAHAVRLDHEKVGVGWDVALEELLNAP